MAIILNIETATKNCSVSIAENGNTSFFTEIASPNYSHAENLHVFIDETLQKAGLAYRDLDAIAVSQGPGSYTGLRIGVSAAKGLCFALDIPLIAVDTLEVLAAQAAVSEGLIVAMLDARRMEVYSATFDFEKRKIRSAEAQIIDADSFSDLSGNVYFAGDCLDKCKPFLTRSNFIFLDEAVFPSAKDMSHLSFIQYKKSYTVDVAYFEPKYLKDFMSAIKK